MGVLEDIWGSIPEVAPFTNVDLQEEQLRALEGNVEAWPAIEKLGGLYQKYMMGGLEKAFPGFASIMGLGGETTQQMLEQAKTLMAGEIPEDVRRQIMRSSAYQSLMGGTAGSQMAGALTARDLGRTSLDLITQGANLAGAGGNAAQQWSNIASNTIMSPSGWVVTPAQQAEMALTNNLIQQRTKQMEYNMAALPDPASAGIHDAAFSLIQAYAGRGMGGGGGDIRSRTPSGGETSGAPGTNAGAMSYYNPSYNYGGYNARTAPPFQWNTGSMQAPMMFNPPAQSYSQPVTPGGSSNLPPGWW